MVKVIFKHCIIYTYTAALIDLVTSKGHHEVDGGYL
jgi:hypothetical protein